MDKQPYHFVDIAAANAEISRLQSLVEAGERENKRLREEVRHAWVENDEKV